MKSKLARPGTRSIASIGIALALVPAIASAKSSTQAPVGGTYAPKIDPANFVAGVDNRYFPLKPGTTLRYRGFAEDGKTPQTDVATTTSETKKILGVTCTVLRDRVTSRGKPVERTDDWYAQDKQGNVWYFGEDARDYTKGRYVKGSDSWEAGVNGAQPGIIMEGVPVRGDEYRQEYYRGHAEDQARVLGSGGAVRVPYRSFRHTLATLERTRLDPGIRERKFYVAGIGEIESRVAVKGNHEVFRLASVKR